jgi:hypothetical protein
MYEKLDRPDNELDDDDDDDEDDDDDPEDVELSSSSFTYSSSSLSKHSEVSVDDMVLVLWGLLKQIYFQHVVGLLIIHPKPSSVRS